MAKSLEQILKDLGALTAATDNLDQELKDLYSHYLEALGVAVKRQLVLATYHLCTQVYPDAFLGLSVSGRETVQRELRNIAEQGKAQILQLTQVAKTNATQNLLEAASEQPTSSREIPDENRFQEADAAVLVQEPREESDEVHIISQRLANALSLLTAFDAEPLTPIVLAKRHVLLDRQLRAVLQKLSSVTNHLLKEAQILPDLPDMVITAAAEAEAEEPGPSTPNLLNVLVEMGRDRGPDEESDTKHDAVEEPSEEHDLSEENDPDRNMTHLVAINLRLADIEFADTQTALWRSKLQEKLSVLKQLSRRYQKLHRAKAKAEAEHAWRATWFEE